ncbi:MAG: uracil-DNA glycosylase [Bacteroidales bacterium]|jgi:uracil-DNA glycosylase|nr:uracil-DNA glycosylase [Bacteroidales bacterium]
MNVQIEESWKKVLQKEFEKPYFETLSNFLHREKKAGKIIYPPGTLIFNAFRLTPFDRLKVVILGQDPYHNPGQAHGLSFSVPDGIPSPPSLKNIYREIEEDLHIKINKNGNLAGWAGQGVFLLNAILTVEAGKAASHSRIGWTTFTDAVIKCISENKSGVVFMLWGNFAKGKKNLIDPSKHLILEAAHPSPLAGGAFFGCRHFSKCNDYLKKQGLPPIDWSL